MGALKLTLHPGSYDWAFQPIAGKTYSDTGKATCHRAAAGDDTSAPSAPGSLRATSVTSTSVSLAWTAGTDDVGVIGYRVVRDLVPPASGTVTATTSATTWTDKDLSPATTYGYQVRAVDAAGNESAPATLVVATPVAPPAPATVTFAPVDDATVDQSRPTTNLGTSTRLVADHSPVNDALMRFVVSGLGGCTVANATLRLTVGSSSDDGSGQGGDVHGAGAAVWSQSTLTWNSAPAAGPALGSIGAVKIGATYAVDVTGSVAGDGPVGFRVTNTSSDGARYYSTEGSATKGPRLTVTCA